ncbi:MAG: radical SAM protein [Campylobacter sp.]|nr:radical SAM protein [Campylobacter sp.]
MDCRYSKSLFLFGDTNGNISISGCCILPSAASMTIEEFNAISLEDLNKLRSKQFDMSKRKGNFYCNQPCVFHNSLEEVVINALLFCNINCYNCIVQHKSPKPNIMPLKVLMEKTLKFRGLKRILMDGSGEIFIVFNLVTEYLKKLNPEITETVMFTTNMTLLSLEKIKILKDISEKTGVRYEFNASIDGISKETFEATRIGAKYEDVFFNLNNIKKEFKTMVSYTVKKPNFSENLDDVKNYFNNMGLYVAFTSDGLDIEAQQRLKDYNKYNN